MVMVADVAVAMPSCELVDVKVVTFSEVEVAMPSCELVDVKVVTFSEVEVAMPSCELVDVRLVTVMDGEVSDTLQVILSTVRLLKVPAPLTFNVFNVLVPVTVSATVVMELDA